MPSPASDSLSCCATCTRPLPILEPSGDFWRLSDLLELFADLRDRSTPNPDPRVRAICKEVRASLDEARTVLDALVIAYDSPAGDMDQVADGLAYMVDAIDEKRDELARLAERARVEAST
jgi:hypothetical protein